MDTIYPLEVSIRSGADAREFDLKPAARSRSRVAALAIALWNTKGDIERRDAARIARLQPEAATRASYASRHSSPRIAAMTIRILLAHDSQQYRAVLRTMLDRQSDVQVVAEAGDGHAAMKEAVAQSPDLVLMDVGMPQMDGVTVTRLILALQPGVRVLALSLHSEPQIVQAMVEAGARGYVLKEDPFPELLRAIREVAAGGTYFSSALAQQEDSPESYTDAR